MSQKRKRSFRAASQSRPVAATTATGTSCDAFRYQPLDRYGRQIRILRLFPGRRQDVIRCSLYTAYLNENPHYEALSYAWGDSEIRRRIIVDGQRVAVTVNLQLALRRLRHVTRDRHLWIDALCINQDNEAEKSHQVNLMKDIYSNTVGAILWLGEYPRQRWRPPAYTNRSSQHRPATTSNPNTKLDRGKITAIFQILDSFSRKNCCPPRQPSGDITTEGRRALDSLTRLTDLPWWKRLWTVQESALPRRATFVYGNVSLSRRKLRKAYIHVGEHQFRDCCPDVGYDAEFWANVSPICKVKTYKAGVARFAYALNEFKGREARDPRDRVFALIGLGGPVSADYSLTTEQVYARTLRSCIQSARNLYPLLRTRETRRSAKLPQWVPDWGAGPGRKLSRHTDGVNWIYYYKFYNAGNRTLAHMPELTSSEFRLDLMGFRVDRIVEVGDVSPSTRLGIERVLGPWTDIATRARRRHGTATSYPRGGSYTTAFWCTMIGDLVNDWHVRMKRRRKRARGGDEFDYKNSFEKSMRSKRLPICCRKRFFASEAGLIGLSLRNVQVGDVIFVFLGGNMPFILRPKQPKEKEDAQDGVDCYDYVGHAYVHGIMDGQVVWEGREPTRVSLE